MIRIRTALAVLGCVAFLPTLTAGDWPAWRGPKGDGSSAEAAFPTTWTAAENVKWKAPVPGSGHSSPIVANGKVFLTACKEAEAERVLACYDQKTGKVLWTEAAVKAPLEKMHKLNSYASATPATDGERVYATFLDMPKLRVFCYDLAGRKVWEKVPGEFHSVHGFCSSPVLYKDLLIVNADQDAKGELRAYIVAYNKKTGEEKYRIDRPNRLRSYCPPVFIDVAGKTQMVLTGSKCVTSYNPDTGEQIWIVNGPTEQFVSSIVYQDGIVFLTAGFPERWVMAIDPKGSGNVTKSHVLWSKKNDGGYVPSPVAAAGHFFVVTDEGMGSCWDEKTGTRTWYERLGKHHSGSGVVAGGHVYFTDDDGVTFVLKATPTFDLVAKNPIGERCYSSPALADGNIFLRGEKHLFCIGK